MKRLCFCLLIFRHFELFGPIYLAAFETYLGPLMLGMSWKSSQGPGHKFSESHQDKQNDDWFDTL